VCWGSGTKTMVKSIILLKALNMNWQVTYKQTELYWLGRLNAFKCYQWYTRLSVLWKSLPKTVCVLLEYGEIWRREAVKIEQSVGCSTSTKKCSVWSNLSFSLLSWPHHGGIIYFLKLGCKRFNVSKNIHNTFFYFDSFPIKVEIFFIVSVMATVSKNYYN